MTTLEPSDYAATLEDLKRHVRDARYTAQRRVNTELLRLYQSIGHTLLQRTESEAWGSQVIAQLANDLRTEFPEMKGFSPSNLRYMRAFARAWPINGLVAAELVMCKVRSWCPRHFDDGNERNPVERLSGGVFGDREGPFHPAPKTDPRKTDMRSNASIWFFT